MLLTTPCVFDTVFSVFLYGPSSILVLRKLDLFSTRGLEKQPTERLGFTFNVKSAC